MAERGLEVLGKTVHQTYIWIGEIAEAFHGSRHEGFQVLRAFLHALRDHLAVDESAQLAAQLPLLIRGLYYEGWDSGHSLQHSRDGRDFLSVIVREAGLREADAGDAVAAVWQTLVRHVSGGEVADVAQSVPKHIRQLLALPHLPGG